ncbi:hypothetical protein B0J18DRAFT_414763 [Chaetomium sp. MPI-SDFR-AT-0129]|nr:hypothetical protein B0J18DRAFT_414763 [Chaetomium sp. MPI-SDFR-AT-0129]
MAPQTLLLLAAASLAHAHFGIEYPPMRANTLSSENEEIYSQWINPCAGVPTNITNRPITPWPLTGGSIKLDLHHPWTYVFINLGLGPDVGNFNYTLTEPFWNVTGKGTLCIPHLELPADLPVTDGSKGSLQVVTLGADGNALYNCADIEFKKDAKVLSGDQCKTDEGLSVANVTAAGSGNATNGDDKGSAASGRRVDVVALTSVAALVSVFVLGLSV